MIKAILYIILLPFTIWAMEGLDLNKLFKQSRVYQARIMYLMIAMSIAYLVVNFLYDFFINFKVI
ncbi:MAG: DUF1146 domain-containing protein [Firmicutes bacterium]|nr:DUF1146 domain-containing protein [Bacillota bacterium]